MDPFQHFLDAQAPVYETVLAELRAGRKRTHWMWFIFPQPLRSEMSPRSRRFALHSLDDARGYLAHPVLGTRLIVCTEALLLHAGATAGQLFGVADAMKLRSSLSLFSAVSDRSTIFQEALVALFKAEKFA